MISATGDEPDAADIVRIGVVGCGYWGPKHIRTFLALQGEGARMVMAADPSADRRREIENSFPGVTVVSDLEDVIGAADIDAVVLATPAQMHFEQASRALRAGKHVLVEKPLSTKLGEAAELAHLASTNDRVLMVGHTYQYAGAVDYIRDIVRKGELGKVSHIRSLRLNLGLFRSDTNVLWDLAPHDLSILLHVLGRLPKAVRATANARVEPGVFDMANLTLDFGDGLEAHIIVSWLDPTKVRQMTFVGERKMLVYDDVSDRQKIQVFERGIDRHDVVAIDDTFALSYRRGGVLTPWIDETEPLLAECRHFIECCRLGKTPYSGPGIGAAVTAIIEAAQRSISHRGNSIALEMFDGAGNVEDWLESGQGRLRNARSAETQELEAHDSPRSATESQGNSRTAERLKAIVVDPDEPSRIFAAHALSVFEPGFEVVTVPNVDEAVEWMQSFIPRLLIVSDSISPASADRLMDTVMNTSDGSPCRVMSIGHPHDADGPMAPWSDLALDESAGLSEWLSAVTQLFERTSTNQGTHRQTESAIASDPRGASIHEPI